MNLFLIVLDQERGWYRYHHLFRQALREILSRSQPAQIPSLHQRIAAWYATHADIENGLHHLVEAECWEEVATQLQKHGVELLQKGKVTRLLRWTERLPDENLMQHPRLMSIYARGLMLSGDLLAVDTWLSYLEQSSAANSATYQEVQQIRAVVQGIEQNPYGPEEAWWDSLTAFTLAINHWANGRVDAAITASERAIEIGQSVGNDAIVMLAASNITFIHIFNGSLSKGLKLARQTLIKFGLSEEQLLDKTFQPNPAVSPLLMAIGYGLYERNELEESLRYYQRARILCEQIGRLDTLIGVYMLLTRTWNALGYPETSQQMISKALKLTREANLTLWPISEAIAYHAWLCLHQGDVVYATSWIEQFDPHPNEAAIREHALEYSVCAEIWLALGDYQKAIHIYEQLLSFSERGVRTEPVYKMWLTYAIALYFDGQHLQALDMFTQVLNFTEKEGYLRHYVLWYEASCLLLEQIIASDTTSASLQRYARRLQKRLDAQTVSGPITESERQDALAKLNSLSTRERAVLHLVEKKLTNQEIAVQLVLSINTVKSHLSSIYRKLGVRSREAAVRHLRSLSIHSAVRAGVVTSISGLSSIGDG
ncbi:MAG: LuxR C-terminal-related transcriptional regulator [Chloroflexota bacterium]